MALLNQTLGLAAIGLQEAKKDRTQNASLNAKENIEEVKRLDEAQLLEGMEAGGGWDLGELDERLRSRVTRVFHADHGIGRQESQRKSRNTEDDSAPRERVRDWTFCSNEVGKRSGMFEDI